MAEVSVSEARTHIRSLLERVGRGEEITLTQNGRPVAVLLHPSQLRARRASPAFEGADHLGELLEEAREQHPPLEPTIPPRRAREMIKDLRAARKKR